MPKILLFVTLLLAVPAHADIGFKIVTKTGYVTFIAGDDWPVIAMQSKLPVAAAAFQLPDPADEGTPESTNLVFKFYEHDSVEAAQSLSQVGQQFGPKPPLRESIGPWTVYSQEAAQNGVMYTILDAKTNFTSVAASVRIAWPHLRAHSKKYDEAMKHTFRSALQSVAEHVGPYVADPNEVIRRPQ